jgi:hypothetical protein
MPPKQKSAVTPASSRPLSALLSQTLVAYTVEFDNEFERRMSEAGHPGAGLSLIVWYTVMRFLNDDGVAVESLESKFALGCLERWRFITLQPAPADTRAVPHAFHRMAGRELRQGWGSARGIRDQWIVRPTTRGRAAIQIWPPLFNEIDQRWNHRFGSEIISPLRRTLTEVAAQLKTTQTNAHTDPNPTNLPLPALLSRLLIAFAHHFNRESKVPLELCANPLRVLGKTPIPERDIPHLTGTSPETSGIGWQLKPFITIERDPSARRGKLIRLNARGLATQASYNQLVQEIEARWEQRFGAETIRNLRRQLEQLFTLRDSEGRLLLALGMLPPPVVRRSGQQAASLGAREAGPAARQRTRDVVEQTAEFVKDPANALPHYPLWDMNRGFGP